MIRSVNDEQPSSGIELAPSIFVPEDAIRFQYSRSSGPGGQNVNKVNTRAELWLPLERLYQLPYYAMARLRSIAGKRITKEDELHLVAQIERTQEGNRAALFEKLRELVRDAMTAPKPRRKIKVSRAAKRRRVEGKRQRAETKTNRREVKD